MLCDQTERNRKWKIQDDCWNFVSIASRSRDMPLWWYFYPSPISNERLKIGLALQCLNVTKSAISHTSKAVTDQSCRDDEVSW